MSTSMADMTYQLKISNMRHHIIELYINLCMNRTFFKINMHNSLSVPIMELGSKNHFVILECRMSLKTLSLVLNTAYRANFGGIFIDVAWQLGGSAVTTDQPPSHQATKPL